MGCATSTANREGEYIVQDSPNHPVSSTNCVSETLTPLARIKATNAIKNNDAFLVDKILQEASVTDNLGVLGDNSTALHVAAQLNSFQAMKTLISWLKTNSPLDIERIFNIQNREGHTPVTLCIINNSCETFYVLLNEKVVKFNYKNSKGQTLEELCKQRSANCLTLLQAAQQRQGIKNVQSVKVAISGQPDQQREELVLRSAAPEVDTIVSKVDRAHIESEEQLRTLKTSNKGPDAVLQGVPVGTKLYNLLTELINSDGDFNDNEFPPELTSLLTGSSHQFLNEFRQAVWKRPHELFACNYDQISLFDDIHPNDISQGLLGVCYLLSTLSATAEFPSRLAKMFVNKNANKYGAYGVTFYVRGVPTEIIVDDKFPCYGDRDNMPLFSKPKGKELWVLLAEKAWAKLYKNYIVCEAGQTHEALEYMLGVPAVGYLTKDHSTDEIFRIVAQADESKHIMCSGTYATTSDSTGLVGAHAYSIISAHDVAGYKILKMRNPWGKFEWKGDFSDQSSLWTDDIKNQVGWVDADDGMFYMTVSDFKQYFETFSVGFYNDGWEYSYVQAQSSSNHAEYFKFTVDRPCDVYFRIHQDDKRSHAEDGQNYKYSPADLIVSRLEDDGTYKNVLENVADVDNSSYWGARSIFATKNHKLSLPAAGEYIIRTKVKWAAGGQGDFTLSAYAPIKIDLQHVSSIKNFLPQFFKSVAKTGQKQNLMAGCDMTTAFYGNYMYLHFENTTSQKWVVNIDFTDFQNLRLCKPNDKSSRTLHVEVPSQETVTSIIKKITPNGSTSYAWSFSQHME